jgi:hypothetical protein
VKARVRTSQFRAIRSTNAELIQLYWSISKDIRNKQATTEWGAKVVDQLAHDLGWEFPGQSGWSATELKYTRRFTHV